MTEKVVTPEKSTAQGEPTPTPSEETGQLTGHSEFDRKLLRAGLPLVDIKLLDEHISDENRKRIMQAKTLPEIREVMAAHAIEATKSKKEHPHP